MWIEIYNCKLLYNKDDNGLEREDKKRWRFFEIFNAEWRGKNIPILAFLHKHPENIPIKYSQKESNKQNKLDIFREQVRNEGLYRQWETIEKLSMAVISGLVEEQEMNPRMGWIHTI